MPLSISWELTKEKTMTIKKPDLERKTDFPPESKIGEKLLQENIITAQQLEEALDKQKSSGGRVGDNLISMGYITAQQLKDFMYQAPPAPKNIEETGLEPSFLTDLTLKHIALLGEFKLADIAENLKLPTSIADSLLEGLKREKMIEVKGAADYNRFSYRYTISGIGQNKAEKLLEVCHYVGPAPVSLGDYRKITISQSIKNAEIRHEDMVQAFSFLVINPQFLRRLGPALISGRAIFLYGPSGNGKTSIAETIGRVFPQAIYIPYTIYVGGELISIYDPVTHHPHNAVTEGETDKRWVSVKRPVVTVGGELTLKTLDLDFNPMSKFYNAPLQMKANNGIFIIDDFGRQLIEPKMLLNRWIVPLERHVDFMTLHTGVKFEIPLDQLIVFATNLEPRELLDEAFLRRIRYKMKIDYPSEVEFEAIFRKVCEARGVIFNQEVFRFLIDNYYRKLGIRPSANHPRDLIDHIIDQSRYYCQPPALTFEGIADAWENYFVEMTGTPKSDPQVDLIFWQNHKGN